MADAEDAALGSAAPLSFRFTRTSLRRRLGDAGGREGSAPAKGHLKAVQGIALQSAKAPEAPKGLVIPLIQSERGRRPSPRTPEPSSEASATKASERPEEERENASADPALQEECAPSREGAGGAPRAEKVPAEADYEAVPVGGYGLAMLRGMGWKPGKGIGRTCSQVVKARVNAPRPQGLGLGAGPTGAPALASSGSCRPARAGGEREKDKNDQPQGLVPGGAVVVLSGPHRELYGKVEGLDHDNVRAIVRLAVGSCVVTVSQYCLKPVSQQEFDENLHPGQVSVTSWGQHRATVLSRTAFQNKGLHGQLECPEQKQKHPPDKQDGPSTRSEQAASWRPHWLRRDLRVRFVDKLHEAGQYYNTKMTIEDVPSPDTCVCRTDEGRVLEGLREDMLETLVPKVKGSRVMVVLGPQAGKVGHLLGRDRAQSRALVQLQRNNKLVELHYNAICQYVGPSDSDED